MLVAICDDEKFFLEELRNILFAYKAERRLHLDVYLYESGEALLADRKNFDMVFLDYQMPGLDGMEVARRLRERNLTCSIVFITAYPEFVFESFEVQPYRFLCKPISPELISDLMTGYIRKQKLLAPITVLTYDGQVVIPSKDILYVEGDGKYCIIRTKDETYHSSKTLAQVHALLPQHCFYRSHKSYVVNLYGVSSFDGAIAKLTNQEVVRIGRSKIPEFKRVYRQFVKDFYVKL
ncbi:MAG: response regulator transcription factor [Oscillospiraceae bacterium]|nr:response regulator transcription factor [Oscillospiraceae bacterium]